MEPYATLADLQARLDWDLDDRGRQSAEAALEDASVLARHYGRDWPVEYVPPVVRSLVLRAAERHLRNPDGYNSSRSGDETVSWSDRTAGTASMVQFTVEEIRLISSLGGVLPGIVSVEVNAYGPSRSRLCAGFVPVDYAGKPFPFFTYDDSPW